MKYNNNIVKNVYVYICLFIKLFLLETDYFRRHNPIIFWAHYSLTYLCNHTVRNNIVLMWDLFLIYIYQTLSTKLYRHLKYRFWQLSRNISEYLSWFDRIKYKYISTCFTQWFYYELFFLSLSQMSVLSLYSHTRIVGFLGALFDGLHCRFYDTNTPRLPPCWIDGCGDGLNFSLGVNVQFILRVCQSLASAESEVVIARLMDFPTTSKLIQSSWWLIFGPGLWSICGDMSLTCIFEIRRDNPLFIRTLHYYIFLLGIPSKIGYLLI